MFQTNYKSICRYLYEHAPGIKTIPELFVEIYGLGASQVALKNPPADAGDAGDTRDAVLSLGQEDLLE